MPSSRNPVPKKHLPDDPFDAILRPPPDEPDEQRRLRLIREQEAWRISQEIDESIIAEQRLKKKRRIVRLLLLGQSESGKSTTLRQFQRLYTPSAFRQERILWRAIIQLNVVRSIRMILDAIAAPTRGASLHYSNSVASTSRPLLRRVTLKDHDNSSRPPPHLARSESHRRRPSHANVRISDLNQNASPSSSARRLEDFRHPASEYYSQTDHRASSELEAELGIGIHYRARSLSFYISPEIEAVAMRLLPIRHVESLLIARLVPPNEDEPVHMGMGVDGQGTEIGSSWRRNEVCVRSGTGWKGVLARAMRVPRPENNSAGSEEGRPPGSINDTETHDEPQEVLNACKHDMMKLWYDPGVREVLRRKKIRLEELPGFFLNDLERVTSPRYMPADDDVLKARLKTIGVSEYKFEMEVSAGKVRGTEWRIVDVGGSRSQRREYLSDFCPTWAPFFDDVDAIIFLAPISGFDQVLVEDKTVNRLEDSVLLWKALCANKLLANVELVLFLNKCDILEAKLNAGVQLSRYVRSYGDRPNDVENVSKFLQSKFSAIHREFSPQPRKFYSFCTSITDTTTTSGIIASVRDMVVRQNLKRLKVL